MFLSGEVVETHIILCVQTARVKRVKSHCQRIEDLEIFNRHSLVPMAPIVIHEGRKMSSKVLLFPADNRPIARDYANSASSRTDLAAIAQGKIKGTLLSWDSDPGLLLRGMRWPGAMNTVHRCMKVTRERPAASSRWQTVPVPNATHGQRPALRT
jgi:hypothetical protein